MSVRSFASTSLIAAAVAVALAIGAGCGTHDHVRLGTAIDPDAAPPALAKLAIPQPFRDLEIALVTPTARIDEARASAIAVGVREALARTNLFDRVTLATPGAPRGSVRLEVAPARYDLREEPGENATSSIIGYLFLGPWSNWFHDRRCEVRCAFDVSFRDWASGAELVGRSRIEGRAADDLSFWERRGGLGPTLGTIVWIPPMAFDSDPEKPDHLLAPRAFDAAARTIAVSLSSLKPRPASLATVRTTPVQGLAARILHPTPGLVRKAETVGVRLTGEAVPRITKVWIGRTLVFDASLTRVVPGAKELLVGRPPALLSKEKSVIVLVQVGDAPPVGVAEITLRDVVVWEPAR